MFVGINEKEKQDIYCTSYRHLNVQLQYLHSDNKLDFIASLREKNLVFIKQEKNEQGWTKIPLKMCGFK